MHNACGTRPVSGRLRLVSHSIAPLALIAGHGTPGNGFEETFFSGMQRLGIYAEGQSFAYRFRHVQFEEFGDLPAPTRIVDGVLRLRFDRAAVWIDETYVAMAQADEHRPEPMRSITWFALTSGECARAFFLPGGPTPTAMKDHWTALPGIVYYSVGLLGPASMLHSAEVTRAVPSDESVESVELRDSNGRDLTLVFSEDDGGAILRTESHPGDRSWSEWTFFSGHDTSMAGLPRRPTCITRARIDRAGIVRFAAAWQEIDMEGDEDSHSTLLPSGTIATDHRGVPMPEGAPRTDRELPLDEFLTFQAGITQAYEDPPFVVSGPEIIALMQKGQRTAWSWPLIGAGILLVATGACLSKRRSA